MTSRRVQGNHAQSLDFKTIFINKSYHRLLKVGEMLPIEVLTSKLGHG